MTDEQIYLWIRERPARIKKCQKLKPRSRGCARKIDKSVMLTPITSPSLDVAVPVINHESFLIKGFFPFLASSTPLNYVRRASSSERIPWLS